MLKKKEKQKYNKVRSKRSSWKVEKSSAQSKKFHWTRLIGFFFFFLKLYCKVSSPQKVEADMGRCTCIELGKSEIGKKRNNDENSTREPAHMVKGKRGRTREREKEREHGRLLLSLLEEHFLFKREHEIPLQLMLTVSSRSKSYPVLSLINNQNTSVFKNIPNRRKSGFLVSTRDSLLSLLSLPLFGFFLSFL